MCLKFWLIINIFLKPSANMNSYIFFTKLPKLIVTAEFFGEFIQTQKRYPTSSDKISVLTLRLFAISSQFFSCEVNFSKT